MFQHVQKHFSEIGQRLIISDRRRGRQRVTIDVSKDKKGEFFHMFGVNPNLLEMNVIDIDRKRIQLLLAMKEKVINERTGRITEIKGKLLCGHDERQLYVASIKPEAVNVFDAFESLKPEAVLEAQRGMNKFARNKRHNNAFLRQGEWFFIPVQYPINFELSDIKHNEPIMRPRSKPHIVEEVLSFGGETVYVHPRFARSGFTMSQLQEFLKNPPKQDFYPIRASDFRSMTRGAKVLARGKVRHPDHYTLNLRNWHEVHMAIEARSELNVFLD